ncbi:Tyrosine protein kinase [Entamoeba marina]
MQRLIDGPPTLKHEDILFDKRKDMLGSGSFGTVYRGIVMGLPVAVKIPNKQQLSETEKKEFMSEISVMKKVFHPNIVLFLGACTQHTVMIVSELMVTDLENLLYYPSKVPEQLRVPLTSEIKLKLCTDMSLAINWLHNVVGLVHRDLKPENFLCDSHMNLKVTDFGFTVFPRDVNRNEGWKGTPYYIAKEVFNGNNVSYACDVYALGLIMWQTFTQLEIFPEYDNLEDYSTDVINGGIRPQINSDVPKLFVKTMTAMWDGDYHARPTMKEVVESLQHVSLENAVTDGDGLKFWKKHFYNAKTGGLRLEVAKKLFFTEINKELQTNIQETHPISKLFDGEISPTTFQKSIDLFGKYFKHTTILNELVDISSKDYFAFEINREIANAWLNDRADGCFLVRFAPKTPQYPFVISYNKNGEYQHNRVVRISTKNVTERYKTKNILNGKDIISRTLPELIEKCIKVGMINTPCPHKVNQDIYN